MAIPPIFLGDENCYTIFIINKIKVRVWHYSNTKE
jgi:hypothetical protein